MSLWRLCVFAPNKVLQILGVNPPSLLCRDHQLLGDKLETTAHLPVTAQPIRWITDRVCCSIHIQSETEITACTLNLFVCNPLIIDVNALISKLRVSTAFENANLSTSLGAYTHTFSNLQHIWSTKLEPFSQPYKNYSSCLLQTAIAFLWIYPKSATLISLHRFLITVTAAVAFSSIIFSSDSSYHIPPHCKWNTHPLTSRQHCNQLSSYIVDACKSGLQSMFVLDYDKVSSTSNLIYQSCQLLMQSQKEPCNSITKRLAPGLSLLRLAALQWGFGNELKRIYQWEYNMCPRAAVFFPLNPLRADRPLVWWALQVFQHLFRHQARGEVTCWRLQ